MTQLKEGSVIAIWSFKNVCNYDSNRYEIVQIEVLNDAYFLVEVIKKE